MRIATRDSEVAKELHGIVTSGLSAEWRTEMASESLEGMADEQWAESSI